MNNTPKMFLKYKNPGRNQVEITTLAIDDLIPEDHKARDVWEFVTKMDTDPCFRRIKSLVFGPGRAATSPEVLFALWLYSIIDGNTSGRKIEELCQHHDAYKWIAGGLPINRTMINDFRSKDPVMFDKLLTNSLAVMVQSGLLKEDTISQDGTRVKASAGNNTYRREKTLLELQNDAKKHIKSLEEEFKKNPKAYDERKKSAQKRAAKERLNRINQALVVLEEQREIKKKNQKKNNKAAPTEEELENVRSSLIDPEARRMKMGDGGFRIAYNVQFATGADSRVIYGVISGNKPDSETLSNMMLQVHKRVNDLKLNSFTNWLADSGYSNKENVDFVGEIFPNCTLYSPPKVNKNVDPKVIRKGDSKHVIAWRNRIDSEEMNEIYPKRVSSAEFSNAQVKNHGMNKFHVRGIRKVFASACLHAITHNMQRYWDLLTQKDGLAIA